jgi:DNA processing protein
VTIIPYLSEYYPERLNQILGKEAPALLFAGGDISILKRKAVGFCGSRNASEQGIRVANDCAAVLAENGINVVSG